MRTWGICLSEERKGPTLVIIVVRKVDDLWFPPWELSIACRKTSVVEHYIALGFTFVDYVGISCDKEYPETVHEDPGHQAKPAHGPDLCNAGVVVGQDLYYNVYSFIEKDPDDVDHQAPAYLGVDWVYEQAADDDGDARQEEDDIGAPTDEELIYQGSYSLVPLVNLSAIAAP